MWKHPGWRLITVGPLVLFLAFFTLAPILFLAVVSFNNIEWAEGHAIWTFVGWANYADVADEPFFSASIRNTAIFAATTSLPRLGLQGGCTLGYALCVVVWFGFC